MKTIIKFIRFAILSGCLLIAGAARSEVIYQTWSAYHHISVIDDAGMRTLSFNGSWETCMSLENPLKGHFTYTEFFQLPLLWNTSISNVLMIGLGGGSTQRAYQHYHPKLRVDTVEIDPVVAQVASKYFKVQETNGLSIHIMDGRMYLDRSTRKFDCILMDAYQTGRYGSEPPFHLVTQEFFGIAKTNLTENGILAYNVIGTASGTGSQMVGNIYVTLKKLFPQVVWLKAPDSENIVILAFRSAKPVSAATLRANYDALVKTGQSFPPNFINYVSTLQTNAPPAATGAQVLMDRYAPPGALRQ